jgi:ribosomal 50S subunit-recycling heat shock protein
MRLDKFLKVSRLIKRRTVANEACDAQCILVNGREQKAGYQVKPGDVIQLNLGKRLLKVEVLSTEDNASKAAAAAMYKELE